MDDVGLGDVSVYCVDANLPSYDSFKIFMGLPTTGGPIEEKKKA